MSVPYLLRRSSVNALIFIGVHGPNTKCVRYFLAGGAEFCSLLGGTMPFMRM